MNTALIMITILFATCMFATSHPRREMKIVLFTLIVFTMIITFRDVLRWSDTQGYVNAFKYHTKTLTTFSFHDHIAGYKERGFYLFSVISKSISDNPRWYLFSVAAMSMFFLYRILKREIFFPAMVLCLYIARFGIGRHLVQMRAGMAILIVLWAAHFITERRPWHYLMSIAVATLIHTSSLIALPTYIINRVHLKKRHVLLILIIAIAIAGSFTTQIKENVALIAAETELAQSYTSKVPSAKSEGKGLNNPMIVYQSVLLLLFTFSEKELAKQSPHYYTLRNGYLYSTLWLILLSPFHVLSARGSTITATFECFLLPLFFTMIPRKMNIILYGLLYVYVIAWLSYNISK